MRRRYGRSDRFRSGRRRRRMGFALFLSLAIVILGGLFFFGVKPYQRAAGEEQAQRPHKAANADVKHSADKAAADKKAQAARAAEKKKAEASKAEAKKAAERKKAQEEQAAAKKAAAQRAAKQAAAERKAAAQQAAEQQAAEQQKIQEEQARIQENPPNPSNDALYLTVPKMGRYGDYIANTNDPAAMDEGAVKLPETGFPWQPHANTYIAAHVLGYSGTGSLYQFAELPNMTYGDKIYLTDSNGTLYTYQVTNIYHVTPDQTWVTDPVPGKNLVTLQTCIDPPVYDLRLIVQAERVSVQLAS